MIPTRQPRCTACAECWTKNRVDWKIWKTTIIGVIACPAHTAQLMERLSDEESSTSINETNETN